MTCFCCNCNATFVPTPEHETCAVNHRQMHRDAEEKYKRENRAYMLGARYIIGGKQAVNFGCADEGYDG